MLPVPASASDSRLSLLVNVSSFSCDAELVPVPAVGESDSEIPNPLSCTDRKLVDLNQQVIRNSELEVV